MQLAVEFQTLVLRLAEEIDFLVEPRQRLGVAREDGLQRVEVSADDLALSLARAPSERSLKTSRFLDQASHGSNLLLFRPELVTSCKQLQC